MRIAEMESQSMRSIALNIRCRPIRFAFLVRHNNASDFKKAIEANTVLWGGIYNPVIPYFKRITSVWKDELSSDLTAKDVIKGYILNFQPDYLVKTFDGELHNDIFPKKRILELKDVVDVSNKRNPIVCGLDMMNVYEHAWHKTFRFVQKNPPKSYLPTLEGESNLFGSVLWGRFPEDLTHYGKDFCQVFDAETKNYQKPETLLFGAITPLCLTEENLKHFDRRPDPCVFIFDNNNLLDLIDYWNLRASGRLCMPWPVSILDKLKKEVRAFMMHYRWKAASNDTKLTCPQIIYSRNVVNDNYNKNIELLSLGNSLRLGLDRYPAFWLDREVYGYRQISHPNYLLSSQRL